MRARFRFQPARIRIPSACHPGPLRFRGPAVSNRLGVLCDLCVDRRLRVRDRSFVSFESSWFVG